MEETLDDLRQGLRKILDDESKRWFKEICHGKIQKKVEMPITSDHGKGRCLKCGFKRKLGQRGHAKGLCKKCRKGGTSCEPLQEDV